MLNFSFAHANSHKAPYFVNFFLFIRNFNVYFLEKCRLFDYGLLSSIFVDKSEEMNK